MELGDSRFKYSSYVSYSNRMPCLCLNGTKRIASFLLILDSIQNLNGFLIESVEFSVNAKYHWGPGTTVRLPWLTWPQISKSQNSLTINRVYLYGFEIWSVLKIAIFGPDDENIGGIMSGTFAFIYVKKIFAKESRFCEAHVNHWKMLRIYCRLLLVACRATLLV